MHTRSLRSLVKISQVASFTEAADQLGMTLSALSMQMKALEESLGVALFDRSVRPPRITPLGQTVVAESLPLLRQEDRLLDICQPSDALVGSYRIGFVTTAAVRLLPGFLLAANRDATRASFEFETGLSAALQGRVLSGRLDAAVITDADGLPGQFSAHILKQEPFVFAAQEQLLKNGLPGLLSNHAFFHFMPDTGIGKLIATAMQDLARPSDARTIVLDNLEAIMECVSAGMGFTLLPLPDVERYSTEGVGTLEAPKSLRRNLVLVTTRNGSIARQSTSIASLLDASS
ncbi:MAG: LysR family transcriptional regulator [Pseudomonadota bacterium]